MSIGLVLVLLGAIAVPCAAYWFGERVGYDKFIAEHERSITVDHRSLMPGDVVDGTAWVVLDVERTTGRCRGFVLGMRTTHGVTTYSTWRLERDGLMGGRVHDDLADAVADFKNRAITARVRVA